MPPHGLARRERQKTPGEGADPSGDARVRRGMIDWRGDFSVPEGQRLGALVSSRTENARGTRKTMIVAVARKLLVALWRLVREAWCRTASFCARYHEQRSPKASNNFALSVRW